MLSQVLALALSLTPAFAHEECGRHAPASAKSREPVSVSKGAQTFGKGITSTSTPLALSEALARKDALQGQELVVKAKVEQVCQSSGCWLTLQDKQANVRVTFENYAFFVPKNSARKSAVVQGKFVEKEISAAEARHYAKDEGKSEAEVNAIQQPVKQVSFEATGLTLS